jgi:hypothetical protein
MRDIETIDGELRLLARAWRVARHLSGCTPSTAHIDELLDERSAATFSGAEPQNTGAPQSLSARRSSAAGHACNVNRQPVDSTVLINNDEVQIGKFRLVFLT